MRLLTLTMIFVCGLDRLFVTGYNTVVAVDPPRDRRNPDSDRVPRPHMGWPVNPSLKETSTFRVHGGVEHLRAISTRFVCFRKFNNTPL